MIALMLRLALKLSLLGALLITLVQGTPSHAAGVSKAKVAKAKRKASPQRRHRRSTRKPTTTRARKLRHKLRRAPKKNAHIAKLLRKATTLALDLDNTVVDTRPRTVAAVKRFARKYRGRLPRGMRAKLLRINKDQVGYDWRETVDKLAIPSPAQGSFERTWMSVFWNPKSLKLDVPVPTTMALIREAQKSGKRIVFVTGRRIDTFQAATVKQLQKLGLINKDTSNLFLKPGGNTAAFKTQLIKSWVGRGERVMLIDDSTANLKVLEKAGLSGVQPVAVGFPVNDPSGPQLGAHIPVLAVQP